MIIYRVKLDLLRYIDSRIIEVEDELGDMEEGIFIPFAKNDIVVVNREKCISYATAIRYTKRKVKKITYYIKLRFKKSIFEKNRSEGLLTPEIGSMALEDTANKFINTNFKINENDLDI